MRDLEPIRALLKGSKGVTLVETLVSATLLGLAFVGSTSMIASGKDFESQEYLRRQAFRIASNILEDTAYSPRRYSALASGSIPRPDDSLKSEGGQRINAPVSLTITSMTLTLQDTTADPYSPGRTVDYKRIDVKVTWSFAGTPDTIFLTKRIAEIP